MSRKRGFAVFLSLVLSWASACGDDASAPTPDAGPWDAVPEDGAPDAGLLPDASLDGGRDAAQNPVCPVPPRLDEPFEVHPHGPDTQIHATGLFDGQAMWVAYNIPDDHGEFDVFATRIQCDTTVVTPPFKVNTTDYNDTDPSLARSGDRILVAWQTDTGAGQDNMQTLLRAYTVDASPIAPTDTMLRTTHDGTPITGNTWAPQVAALPGGFVLAGTRATPDATGLQIFVQRLDLDGLPSEPTIGPVPDPSANEMNPALATTEDGALYLAFEKSLPPDFTGQVVSLHIPAGAQSPDLGPVPTAGYETSEGPAVTVLSGHVPILAFSDPATGAVVLTVAAMEENAPTALIGHNSRIRFSPQLAANGDTGVIVWYENISGLANEFWVQAFRYDGAQFTLGPAEQVTQDQVPPYPPAVAHVGGDIYFFAWSVGKSPHFRIRAVFHEVPPP